MYKVTKPKANQILIENEDFKDVPDAPFKADIKNNAHSTIKDKFYDEGYEGIVVAYRHKGMESSRQMMVGNTASLVSLAVSVLKTLIFKECITFNDLDKITEIIKADKNLKKQMKEQGIKYEFK